LKTREEIISENPIERVMEARGIVLKGSGAKRTTNRCATTEHKPQHQCVSVDCEKGVWNCHDCDQGGSVVDFVMLADGLDAGAALRKLAGESEALPGLRQKFMREEPRAGRLVKAYDYTEADGTLLYQALRYEPKTFRQRRQVSGQWVYDMKEQRLVLYNLPRVKASPFVFITEGEKDADTINAMRPQFVATCNVGGAGKWLDSYSQTLKSKDVIICGDTDKPGRDHVAKVAKALEGLAKTVCIVELPPEFKDVTEYAATFATPEAAGNALLDLAGRAEVLTGGVRVPIRSMYELEREYEEFAMRQENVALSLGRWLPKLGNTIRPLVPGELVTFIADTGVGKTMLLQNLVLHTELLTLMFELELPGTLTFERFVGIERMMSGGEVAAKYRAGERPDWKTGCRLNHIHVCTESRLTILEIEGIILKAGLKLGKKPQLVLLDYIQLVQGKGGSRYERMSSIAEELKILAKSTNTIVVIASQVARGQEEEISLHSAKDSGSIENSSGLVLGAWRDSETRGRMWLKVCKNTKGFSGAKTALRIGSDLMLAEEQELFQGVET
jgi:hypothetical protein